MGFPIELENRSISLYREVAGYIGICLSVRGVPLLQTACIDGYSPTVGLTAHTMQPRPYELYVV